MATAMRAARRSSLFSTTSILAAAPYSSSAAPSLDETKKYNIIITGHHHFNKSDYAWNPLKVKTFGSLLDEALEAPPKLGDKNHWLVHVDGVCSNCLKHLDSFSEEELFDFYAWTITLPLAIPIEQARLKIYLVSCERPYGYGAEFNEATQKCLQDCGGVQLIREDCYYSARIKDGSVQPVARFTAFNPDYISYNDLYSYHFLCEPNMECKSDYWIVHLKQPECVISNYTKCIHYCVRLLAQVVGSEDEAKEKIYMVWCAPPFGFAAEIDKETLNKLKVLQDVLALLPDYSVSPKTENIILLIAPPKRRKIQPTIVSCYDKADIFSRKYGTPVSDSVRF
ncbi:hypothetical protein IFM89_013350 [Coptis chinensis]|uniref:MORF/ORRM1/DAG-like MORF domain-containing protein n=1 Tax=Coptis chinensis TaxID=261450 RepID=A0A835I236_9MAGN|nr:hypothetical protein IFM89_013350 [Coptis chinensis]